MDGKAVNQVYQEILFDFKYILLIYVDCSRSNLSFKHDMGYIEFCCLGLK